VREEQRRLRPDLNAPITGEVLNEMVYTRQVVKEVLRFRGPGPRGAPGGPTRPHGTPGTPSPPLLPLPPPLFLMTCASPCPVMSMPASMEGSFHVMLLPPFGPSLLGRSTLSKVTWGGALR